MDISFSNPFILILIPLSLFLVFYFSRKNKMANRKKINFINGIRTVIFILLILSLSGINIRTYVDSITTIFAVDMSQSTVQGQDEFKSFIEQAIEYSNKNDRIGVVTFGQGAQVEIPVTDVLSNVDFETNPGSELTNIEEGLKISRALIPQNTMKRIVLMTDGEENLGDSLREGNLIKYDDIDFKVYKVNKKEFAEVQLKNLSVPKLMFENQTFDIITEIYSNSKTTCKVILYSNGSILGEKEVVVEKGNNKFLFKDKVTTSGFQAYKAVIIPEKDTITQNNSFTSYTNITGKANVLLIDGESQGGKELNKILSSSGINVNYLKDRSVPHNLSELTKYEAIVMCDVSLENISNDFVASLKTYVKDYGGGLVVTGGENSYALGGYYKTPLEEILPVNMEMKVNGEVPSLGLVLVIDKSGSMTGGQFGINKIDMAKEAAVKAVNSLKPKDQIGVIAFDDTVQWVVNLTETDDILKIKNDIATISSGGGTSIIPSLDEAYLALKDAETKLKHIILLTDGQAEREGYFSLLNNMKEAGITISTVAIGQDSDTQLLESIADLGKGRYYFVDEYSNIPEIFTKETFLASKSYINNRPFIPRVEYYNKIISPFNDGIPVLNGYIGASPKDRAEVILKSDRDDPILATWQYGLGRSIAWTSDIDGRWTSEYLNSDRGIEFINNLVDWVLPRVHDNKLSVEANIISDKIELVANNLDDFDEGYITKANIIYPNQESIEIELKPTKPGEYKVEIPVLENGIYIAKINQFKDDEIVNTINKGIAVNYSKEYDITAPQNRLTHLLQATGGKYINKPDEVFSYDLDRVHDSKDISRPLLILALLLFIIDIALRRLNLKFKKAQAVTSSLNKKVKQVRSKSRKIDKNIAKVEVNTSLEGEKSEEEPIKKAVQQEDMKSKQKENNALDTSRLLKAKVKRKK